ncbi:hypothetical protein [Mesorhizobium sp. SP-1A]|uniref:hypothetical protein n=1 Tax=Mesorhizobium sp. SP-1A TaxID=3077840 RepID=UPI0028F71345|nr:hypothetical protein [Mesorhizobium sp. SP-1A]
MGWANASYKDAVIEAIGLPVANGKAAARLISPVADLSDESRTALRRYSVSEFAGQEDGKALNRALLSGDQSHSDWVRSLDDAFVWAFKKDILLWRGGETSPNGEPNPAYTSTSLVERQARQFRSRGSGAIAAIVLPAGSRIALPSYVWGEGDDERTLGVVRREVEILLPRGTQFGHIATVDPFEGQGNSSVRVRVMRATVPNFDMAKEQELSEAPTPV